MYIIKKGLDIPILGQASGEVEPVSTQHVAVLGPDYLGMKPTMLVAVGDSVKRGQKLFEDKKNPGIYFTAPIAGTITAINRGYQRALLSVVIERGDDEAVLFSKTDEVGINDLSRETVVEELVESGLWTAIRTRPFSKVPAPNTHPHSIFITAIDTNPLALCPAKVIAEDNAAFQAGLSIVNKLTDGKTYLCKRAGSQIAVGSADVEVAEFQGPHPAGLVGTHIHTLDPVNMHKTVWHLNYQDVIAIGRLFITGELDLTRVIAVGGPAAAKPKLIKTMMGASLIELLVDQDINADKRVINGSVLTGAFVNEGTEFLGRYALQIAVLEEGDEQEFIGWLKPGADKFTATKAYLGGITQKLQNLTTSSGGSPRSMVPIGVYEKVMPLDILPTLLLKSIIVKDTDEAQKLGVLELDEEDLALCTFVCPSKYEYGAILRENLEKIEKEG